MVSSASPNHKDYLPSSLVVLDTEVTRISFVQLSAISTTKSERDIERPQVETKGN